MNDHLAMLGRFVRSPRTVGAIAPSSRVLATAMIETLDLSGAARVVELGPGTGVFTQAIAARLGPDARGLAVDIDPGFVAALSGRWPQVAVVCGSAAQLPRLVEAAGFTQVDHVISGLPFASLPGDVTNAVLDGIGTVLQPGGTFTTFQYVHGYHTPLASAFRREMTRRLGGAPSRRLVVRNIPPAYVLGWTRRCG